MTKESKEAGSAPFAEIQVMAHDAVEQRVVRDELPMELVSKTLGALAEVTIELMAANPTRAAKYRTSGFEMLWAGITTK